LLSVTQDIQVTRLWAVSPDDTQPIIMGIYTSSEPRHQGEVFSSFCTPSFIIPSLLSSPPLSFGCRVSFLRLHLLFFVESLVFLVLLYSLFPSPGLIFSSYASVFFLIPSLITSSHLSTSLFPSIPFLTLFILIFIIMTLIIARSWCDS
jgi:hypothetical protein